MDDEDEDEDVAAPPADEEDDDEGEEVAEADAADFRAFCDDLAEAIISVTSHDRCPAYANKVLLDAITELSNHQYETKDEESEFVRRACRNLAR